MLIACGQDRFGALDQVQGLAGVAADRLALGFDGMQPRKEFRGGGSATNAASLDLAAGCQPVPVTFSSRTSSCPLNVAELL